ncbi:enhancer of mRNA-decapping protein 3 [Prorops nasuta]|uniref:enhancer of mRNA-decapping protein 3 n=1 Tax=Prorops nasuta TaxID=863751 RepID=UPI0034CD0E94
MSEQFLGCTVSIKCVDDLGTYQGKIMELNKNSVTLSKVFCNGVPCSSYLTVLDVKDIANLEIISTEEPNNETTAESKITVKRPIAKRPSRSVSESTPSSTQCTGTSNQMYPKKQTEQAVPLPEPSSNGKQNPFNVELILKRINRKQRTLQGRDEHTFGTPIDESLDQDFDFEKNLALFDKKAVWQEINSLKPDIVKQSDNRGAASGKYKHTENILSSEPTVLRQISVPAADEKEYVTDNGLVIPSITLDLHRQLIGAADRLGISWERRVELLGRAGAEMILQLLGGSHRLNPNNAHQWPTVVALCGPHRSGAAGVNCARQLSSHGVKTIVYIENSEDVFLLQELSLYKLTENKVETKIKNLPSVVDLIIVALCDENSRNVLTPIASWAKNKRAPIIAIEPPSFGTPGIRCKFSLLGGLPLSHNVNNGRLYLCNLALPGKVFSDVGITYRSPFGPKFVIPLHSNNS